MLTAGVSMQMPLDCHEVLDLVEQVFSVGLISFSAIGGLTELTAR